MKQKRHPIKNQLKAFATVPSQGVLEACQVSAVPHWDTECWTLLQCYLVVRHDLPEFFSFFLETLFILQNIKLSR